MYCRLMQYTCGTIEQNRPGRLAKEADMVNGFDSSQEERLRRAEKGQSELTRLQPVTSEAAQLRLEKAKAEKAQQRHVARPVCLKKPLPTRRISAWSRARPV